jgi:hypothetical protein
VGEIDGQQGPAVHRPLVQVIGDAPPQHTLALGIAAPQVRVHHLAHQLVQRQALSERLREAARRKPRERLVGIHAGEHITQEIDGGDARRGRHAERSEVEGVQLGVRKPADQRLQHARALDRVVGAPFRRSAHRVRAEGQGQRRALGPGHELGGDAVLRHAVGAQQLERLLLGQRAQLEVECEALPTAIEPRSLGAAAAGDDHDGQLGQRRQQLAAQVSAHRGHPLVAVEKQQRTLAAPGCADRELERVGNRRQLAALHEGGLPAASLAAPRHLPEKGALADPSRPVEEHEARLRIVDEEIVEGGKLGTPAHQAVTVTLRQASPERSHDR